MSDDGKVDHRAILNADYDAAQVECAAARRAIDEAVKRYGEAQQRLARIKVVLASVGASKTKQRSIKEKRRPYGILPVLVRQILDDSGGTPMTWSQICAEGQARSDFGSIKSIGNVLHRMERAGIAYRSLDGWVLTKFLDKEAQPDPAPSPAESDAA